MVKNKELKREEKGGIIALWKNNFKVAEIARQMELPDSTVRSFIKRYNERGNLENLPRSGRPSVITERQGRLFVRKTMKNRHVSLRELTTNVDFEGARATASNYLHNAGIGSYVAVKKPFISKENQKQRLLWCKERINWSVVPEWSSIIWSDESSVEIGQSSRRELVWRKAGERYNSNCLRPTFKSGRKSVMVWGCFVGDRLGPLVICEEGRMNSDDYIKILNDNLKEFKTTIETEWCTTLIYQDDNAKIHTSKKTCEWKRQNRIESLPWPAQSPDLNPIENLWKILKDKTQQRKPFPRTVEQLKIALKEEWCKLESHILLSLVSSMPKRVKLVVEAKGGHSKY
jgi:transposase